jgi:formate hydrogenlyase subunit 3/multisubunit Na+/H+ antiporter MnhD subunit
MRSRAVHWFLFPVLAGLLTVIRLHDHPWSAIWQTTLINMGFLAVQLFIVTLYFSLKNKKWVNITQQLLGWGDVLFLLNITVYLSALNFLFFYIVSLTAVLLLWLSWQVVSSKKNKYIPLAGFQSLIFILFLAGDWWYWSFNMTEDAWLLNLISK